MESRDVQVVIAVILAGIVGFALATLLMDDDEPVTPVATNVPPTTTVTSPAPAPTATTPADGDAPTQTDRVPTTEAPEDGECIELWNQENNTSPQAFVADLQNRQAIRVNVGATTQAPLKCLVTVIANDGSVYRFTEGAGQAFPYSPRPARLQSSALSAEERQTDALSEEGGRLSAR